MFAKLQIVSFEGKTPRVYTKLTDESKAQIATNCDLRYGNLRPLKGMISSSSAVELLVVDLGGSITAFADYSGTQAGTVKATTNVAHGLSTDDEIVITGTTNYDLGYQITVIDTTSFYFTAAWAGDDGTGEWFRNLVVVQDSTGDCSSTAVSEPSSGTVRVTSGAAHTVEVGDHIWFDATMGDPGYYPSAYPVTSVNDVGNSIDFTATFVTNADPSDSDWFSGDIVATSSVYDIYLLNDEWISFSIDTDVAESFIEDNNYRVYYTSPSGMRQTDYDLAIQGEPYQYPYEYYSLGVQQPNEPLSVTVATDSDQSAITVDQSTAYVYTYVTGLLEEGPPSDATEVVDIDSGEMTTLSGGSFTYPTGTGKNIDYVRIYKTVTSYSGAEYQIIKKRGLITAVADSGANNLAVFTSTNHRLLTGDTVLITGTTNYNGTYTVVSYSTVAGSEGAAGDNDDQGTVTDDYFELLDSDGNSLDYVAEPGIAGYWNQTNDITITEAKNNGFIDRTNPADAGIVMFTTDFDPPPTDLENILLYTNNTYAGFSGNTLCFSEPNYPYAWPVEYQIPVAHNIIGLGHHMESVVVCTDVRPYITVGTDPQTMILTPLPYKRPCIAKRGIVSTPHGVFYPTHDGLFHLTSSGGKLITDGLITREQWNEYDLDNIHAVYFDDRYHAFFLNSTDGFYIDLLEPLRIIDVEFPNDILFKNAFTDGEELYVLAQDSTIYSWCGCNSTWLTYTWKSKKFQWPTYLNMSAAQVINDGTDDLTFKFYVDDILKHTETVSSNNAFRLPSGFRGRVFEIELTGTSHVDIVTVSSSINQLFYERA